MDRPDAANGLPDGVTELVMPDDVVTGEAVVLDLRPASFATRVLAYLLDLLVITVLSIALFWMLSELFSVLDVVAGAALYLVISVSLLVLIPAGWETLSRGRSLGKLAAGLRVVRDDGGPIRWRQAFARSLVAVPEIYITGGSVALICSLWNPRGKRVGDLLAGTYVVRERVTASPQPPLAMPPELAGWAGGADIARLPDPLAVAARQMLARAHLLHPASRTRLGGELAAQMATYVAPAPPGVVHPERFICAVLAERHTRALARLTAQQQRRMERDRRRGVAAVLSPASSRLVEPPSAPSTQPIPPTG
jgi:uncharacterized RDD family membrane protein YckC